MIKISKTDGEHLYINLLNFKDKEEQEKYYKIIKDVIYAPKKFLFTIEDGKILKVEPLDKETQELKKTLQQIRSIINSDSPFEYIVNQIHNITKEIKI